MYIDAKGISKGSVLNYLFIAHPFVQFFKSVHKTKQNLAKVRTKVELIHSRRDETVSVRNVKLFKDRLKNVASVKTVMLNRSSHVHYEAEEQKIICDELTVFIK